MKIIIRPHGNIIYTVALVIVYAVFAGVLSFGVLFIIEKCYWALLLEIPIMVILILQTKELIRHKIELSDNQIYLTANNALFMPKKKDLKISYKNLKSMQYFSGFIPISLVSVIVLEYNSGKLKYLDVFRFSEKQITLIIKSIKELAEKYNSYPIEVKPDNIQKGFRRSKKNR
jgi:hypothetical protein